MKLNMKTMIIAGAVVAAMALEGIAFLLFMPSSPKNAAGETADPEAPAQKEEAVAIDTAEEPLGDPYTCTNNVEESMMHLRFKVAAVVKSNQQVPFRDAVTAHKTRIRQTVETIFRRAERTDLNDASLSTLKRLIREEVNKVLGKSYVIEAVIYDFSMIEQ